MTLPLDHDGFLRRECPHCLSQFKWHDGPASEQAEAEPAPVAYHCPFCGQPAGHESWWTQEQLDYARGLLTPAALREAQRQLKDAFRAAARGAVRIELNGNLDVPDAPLPLTEPDDMIIVASPCHGYEPVKVPDGHSGPFFCLVCGSAFAT